MNQFERRARKIRRRVGRYPFLRPIVNRVGLVAWRRQLRSRQLSIDVRADPARTLFIDPRAIDRYYGLDAIMKLTGTEGFQRNAIGSVLSGDWDLADGPLSDLLVFEGIRQRVEGAEWDDTQFVRSIRADVEAGIPRFKFRRPEDIPVQLARIDDLIAQVREHGFRSQSELRTGRPWDEILVALDRRGVIKFVDGRHRLAVARALGIDKVPALAVVRHSDWQRFTDELRAYADSRGGRSYQPYLHPDVADIPAEQQGEERFEVIAAALPVRRGRLLDVGANKGYFCHRFEELGFECVAAERSEKELYFLTGLRDASNRKFEIFRGTVFDVPSPESFEVVNALNIFHHFLKTEESYRRFERFLGQLQCNYLVFESHRPGDPQMRGAFVDYAPNAFVEFLQARTGLSTSTSLGTAADGRPMFLLTR